MSLSNLSYFLYLPFYKISKYFLESVCDHVSTRHSFYFKKIVFLISDIDFTLFVKGSLSKKGSIKIRKRFNLLKKIFPILGECNVYDQESIDQFILLLNPLEAARDPFLFSQLKLTHEISLSQKLIFLMRLFKGDQSNLQFRLQKRFQKLSYCFSLFHPKRELLPSDVSNLDFLIRYLKQNVIEEEGWAFLDFLILKTLRVEQGDTVFEKLWNIDIFDSREGIEFDSLSNELFFQNICWEFWGLCSQIPFIRDYRIATNYLLIQQANLLSVGKDRDDIEKYKEVTDHIIEQFQNFID